MWEERRRNGGKGSEFVSRSVYVCEWGGAPGLAFSPAHSSSSGGAGRGSRWLDNMLRVLFHLTHPEPPVNSASYWIQSFNITNTFLL